MYTIKKRISTTCTSHYLGKGYPNKCKNLHGHNYFYDIEVAGDKLDEHDMLIDFGMIKKYCDKWLQENWDHATILSSFQTDAKEFWNKIGWRWEEFPIKDVNITAERMSEFLAKKFYKELKQINSSIKYVSVSVWETEDSVATFKADEGIFNS